MQNLLEESRRDENQKGIETATSYETSIPIIPESECQDGLEKLRREFKRYFPHPESISVVPILRAGERLGRELTEQIGLPINPMRMSYTKDDTSRLPEPICLFQPDITQIATPHRNTKQVIFTECVVDTQGTILGAMAVINTMIDNLSQQTGQRFKYPDYFTILLG